MFNGRLLKLAMEVRLHTLGPDHVVKEEVGVTLVVESETPSSAFQLDPGRIGFMMGHTCPVVGCTSRTRDGLATMGQHVLVLLLLISPKKQGQYQERTLSEV